MARGQESHLAKHGITGIRYLDAASRDIPQKYVVNLPNFGGYDFNSLKEAQEFIAKNPKEKAELIEPTQTTSNFVVFDPKHMNILERNGVGGAMMQRPTLRQQDRK